MPVVQEQKSRSTFEDKVILITIAASLLVALLLFLFSNEPGTGTVVATFLGLGLAAMVYRFLGGVGETSFQIKAWKIAGTGAFLIGTIWFIDSRLQTEIKWEPEPNNTHWFAVDNRGLPIGVKVSGAGEISMPKEGIWDGVPLQIQHQGEKYKIFTADDSVTFSHGYLSRESLAAQHLSNSITLSIKPGKFVVTDSLLRPYTKYYNLDPLPFYISTNRYGGEFSRYALHDKTGEELYRGQIQGRGAEIIQIDSVYYFVAVTMVNHQPVELKDKYAKFVIGEVAVEMAIK